MPRSSSLIAGALLLAGFTACGGTESPEHPAARSLLLITLDTVRADHLGSYAYPRDTSPALDAFIERGARFEYAFSTSSRTAPSHASIMTGLYPSFHSVDIENAKYRLEGFHKTLAEGCEEEGLRTAAIVSNPVLNRRLALDQGFREYDDRFERAELNRASKEKTAETTTTRALEKLAEFGGDAFFLWVHYQDPHGPYAPPPAVRNRFANDALHAAVQQELEAGKTHSGHGSLPRYQVLGTERRLAEYVRLYDAEIRYMDDQLGRLFDALYAARRLEDTLVVLTADHGEAFGEGGYFCAHGHGLGLDQNRVPLAFVGAGVQSNVVLRTPVSNLDVFATALEALGVRGTDPQQSTSLWSALVSGSEPEEHRGYAESVTQRAIFGGETFLRVDRRPLSDRKFWESRNPYTQAPYQPLGEPRMTRLASTGPGGEQSLPGASGPQDPPDPQGPPGEARDLFEALERFSAQADETRGKIRRLRRADRKLTGDEEEQLRALGYVE